MNNCIQCGKETDFKQLQTGVWACEDCLTELAIEQKKLREEIEDILFEAGCPDYESVCNMIGNITDIIKYMYNQTSISEISQIITSLEAIDMTLRYQNNLLDEENKEKMNKIIENW